MNLTINEDIYCLEAIEKASYRFIDRLTILITKVDGIINLEIEPVLGFEKTLDSNIADFKRELLDQQLRKQIKDDTESVRNLILSYAFSKTDLQK